MDSRYDFQVIERELKTDDGVIIPNHKAIIREDTGNVLSVMGKDYAVVRHSDVIDQFEKALPSEIQNRKVSLCKGGAVLFAKYETPKIDDIEVKKGDIVKFGIEIFNSYDGSLPVGFVFTALRLVCTNGMVIPKSIARISVRHRGNPELTNIRESFTKRIPLYLKMAQNWREWTQVTPDNNRVIDFFKTSFGKRYEKTFANLYNSSEDKTLWGLYNVLTKYCTHDIKVRKNNTENKRLTQWNFEQKTLNRFYNYNWR